MMDEGEAQPEPEPTHEVEAADSGDSGMSMGAVSAAQVPMVAMLFSSIILLISVTTTGGDNGWETWGIVLSSIALAFSFIGFFLAAREDLMVVYGRGLAIFLAAWCLAGAISLTFWGQFKVTTNGYFAAWALAVSSIMGIGVSAETMKSHVQGIGAELGLFLSAVVVLIAIPGNDYTDENSGVQKQSIYGLVLSCVTILLVGIILYMQNKGIGGGITKFVILACFAIMWIVCASFLTFKGPFTVTSNGYFGSWAAAVTSVLAAMSAKASM